MSPVTRGAGAREGRNLRSATGGSVGSGWTDKDSVSRGVSVDIFGPKCRFPATGRSDGNTLVFNKSSVPP
jgi:hypothetical protein